MPNLRLIALLLCAAATPAAADLSCEVVGVSDGDTITAMCGGREQVRVRLAEIDAPEKSQPFGAKSKQSLSDLCFEKRARIASQGRDRYGRTIGRVYCFKHDVKTGIDANAEQVRRGFAWVYDRYVTDQDLYTLQDTARAHRRGLWADNGPMPPWDWRKIRN